MSPAWVPIDEAVQATGISRATLDRWIAAERIRSQKYPRDRRTYVELGEIAAAARTAPRRSKRDESI